MLCYSVCKQVTHLILLITWLCGWPFIPQEWLATNFSLQYHLWIKCKVHENKRNDHQFKSIQKLLLVGTDGKYIENSGENMHTDVTVWGVKGERPNWIPLSPITITDQTVQQNKTIANLDYFWCSTVIYSVCLPSRFKEWLANH